MSVETTFAANQSIDSSKVVAVGKSEPTEPQTLCVAQECINGLEHALTEMVRSRPSCALDRALAGTNFHSRRPPSITIKHYLWRIHHFFGCSDECFVLAMVYINRAAKQHSSMVVCELTVHRLLIVAMMLAAKSHDDERYGNSHYAKVGGLTLEQVNDLELKFMKMLDWNTFVAPGEYQCYYDMLCPSQTSPRGEPEPEASPRGEPEPEVPAEAAAIQ